MEKQNYNKAKTIIVRTETTALGTVIKAGTRIYAQDTDKTYVINVDSTPIDSLSTISNKSEASFKDSISIGAIITDVITLTPRATAPTPAAEGMLYSDSSDDTLRVYLNSAWYWVDKTLVV